jgi:TolA-binding protein
VPITSHLKTWAHGRGVKAGLIVFGVLLSILYVVQMNMTATKGYEIRQLEQTLAQLQDHAKELKLQALELQSMDRLDQQMKSDGSLVRAPADGYVSVSGTAVAQR